MEFKTIGDYEILDKIHETIDSIIFHGKKKNQQSKVIIKVLKQLFPSSYDIARFKHEFHLINELKIPGVIKSLELVEENKLLAIIEEDFNGISLKKYLGNKALILDDFLEIAVKISEILGQLHKHSIVHRDIKPANILINVSSKEIKISDFGLSAIYGDLSKFGTNSDYFEGTLAYISPEQTGRMNRLPDYRSDIYSLGVTFYELITGTLPFRAATPLELIHAHIAQEPKTLNEQNKKIPLQISRIILKLMNKSPEHRYQNCFSLHRDFMKCKEQLESSGVISEFPLAEDDAPLNFTIPQSLVGRDQEMKILLDTCENVRNRTKALTLIRGEAGIGKSALVLAFRKYLLMRSGYFASGRFESLKKEIPYYGIIQAFQVLVDQLLLQSKERIEIWRNRLTSNLGNNMEIMLNIFPVLERITGSLNKTIDFSPEEIKNRFANVFVQFIKTFTLKEHPLILFLDDLQWADSASFNLIKFMATNHEINNLYLIGAYRDNEIDSFHPLSRVIEEIRQSGANLKDLKLAHLKREDINAFIINSLHCKKEHSLPLARLIHDKTAGNPFFAGELLRKLYKDQLLFLSEKGTWQWDIAKIEKLDLSHNLIDLMVSKLEHISKSTLKLLQICSCIGTYFNPDSLAEITGKSIDQIKEELEPAINARMLFPFQKNYEFQHNKIREAAYSLLDGKQKSALHYRIGMSALKNSNQNDLNKNLFYITDQLNRAVDLQSDYETRNQLMDLNLQSARKAKKAAAFSAAIDYLEKALSMLTESEWNKFPENKFNLTQELAESLFLSGNLEKPISLIDSLLALTENALQKSELYMLKAKIIDLRGDTRDKVLKEIQKGLKILNMELPEDPEKIEDEIGKALPVIQGFLAVHEIESLIDLPRMTDPDKIMIMNLLFTSIPAAIQSNFSLFLLIGLTMFNMTIQNGTTAVTSKCFVDCGVILGSLTGNYKAAYQLGKTAFSLIEKQQIEFIKPSTYFIFSTFLSHWQSHFKESLNYFNLTCQYSIETGDIYHESFAMGHRLLRLFYTGTNLETIISLCDETYEHCLSLNSIYNAMLARLLKAKASQLAVIPDQEKGNEVNEINQALIKENLAIKNIFANFLLGQLYMMTAYLLEDFDEAGKWAQFSIPNIPGGAGHFQMADMILYLSLVLIEQYKRQPPEVREKTWENLTKNLEQLKFWSDNCPANFSHKYFLLKADMSVINKAPLETTISLYNQALLSIENNDFIHMKAIIYEHYGEYWLEQNHSLIGKTLIKEAYHLYDQWGAKAKNKLLEKKYPLISSTITDQSFSDNLSIEKTNQSSAAYSLKTQNLDLQTVVETSQLLLSEIELEKLLIQITKSAIENTGAQYGFLIIVNENTEKLMIEVSKTKTSNKIILQQSPLENSDDLAHSIVRYVFNTGKNILLNDASENRDFASDPHIINMQPKSILCTPALHKGKVIGILYLENNLTTHAFTPSHAGLMQIIAAQAAISIENSRLISHREKAAKLETEMELAKRIQTTLIPQKPRLKGYEISTYIKPADSINGDYYDIINSPSGDWILIGDVSGHGVTAGLVMMMAQTAIHTILNQYDHLSPSELLTKVNKTITNNIHLMGDMKYMTLMAIQSMENGHFSFAGVHQDILIYRTNTKTVESVETNGVWIGFLDDIEHMSPDNRFHLESGDSIMLFTDGIVEAEKLNTTGDNSSGKTYFTLEKLINDYRRIGHLSPSQITQQIISEFKSEYKSDDDTTLLVIKRA